MAKAKDVKIKPGEKTGIPVEEFEKKVEFFDPNEVTHHFRSNVGARNPLVIARRIAKPQDRITDEITDKKINRFIKKAFADPREDVEYQKFKDIKYKDLFDPKSGSPLYRGLKAHTSRLKMAEDSIEKNKFLFEIYKRHIKILDNDSARKIEGPGEIPDFCKDLVRSQNQVAYITKGGVQKAFQYMFGAYNNGLEFSDPVQGCVANCWFISALSSVAWAEQTAGFQKKLSRVSNKPNFWPVTAPGVRTKTPITVTSEYYLDSNSIDTYYARSNSIPENPTKYESWGPCYEKACTDYWEKQEIPPFANPVNAPNYEYINYKDAIEALSDITGLQWTANTTGYTNTYLTNPANTGFQIIERLRTGICASITFTQDEEFIGARKPAVAYTYMSADDVPSLAPLANSPYYPVDVIYNCPGVPANHAFSILGLYRKPVSGSYDYYVVLRNPWGFAGTADAFTYTEPDGSIHDADVKNGWTGGLKAAVDASGITTLGYINDYDSLGIFGLRSDYFMRYFEAFGWVQ